MIRVIRIDSRWLAMLMVLASCDNRRGTGGPRGELPPTGTHLFTLLPSAATGIAFENRLVETSERNVFTYRNYYNGGGVAIGDLNGDGLPEVVLTSNEQGPRLYLNQGQFRFRDVTQQAGLKDDGHWTTGVVLADVNADGRLDIYVSRAGPLPPERRANALWINQGLGPDSAPTFKDLGEQYGVADRGYSTHAAFLDYDRDGDLDLFVINNSPRAVTSFGRMGTPPEAGESRDVPHEHGGAKLYRRDGDRFSNVTAAARIHSPEMAFGLGIAVGDMNRDGWPDVYVANDFFERDYLYVNNKDGTFRDDAERAMSVQSAFSMGLDIGDLDGDAWPDIYTTDMLPEGEQRFKENTSFEQWDSYMAKVRGGYHHQLSRNMLQRNNQDGTFSDVGQLAGVSRTDWTWSALIADFDLDGRNDIFVANGMARDITSQDYLALLSADPSLRPNPGKRPDFLKLTNATASTPIANYAFRNLGALRFMNEAEAWGLATPTISSGAAYGDLDGDGALDLVVNNINAEAFVYRNNARALRPENRFLRVRLVGEKTNPFGVGAKVEVGGGRREAGSVLTQELNPSRGFQSSVDYTLTFGLGANDTVTSVRVLWPDGRESGVGPVAANTLLLVRQADGVKLAPPPASPPGLLTDVTTQTALPYVHKENDFTDFDRERLIPKLLSIEGPPVAVADVNGDGLDDAYFGGAKGQPGKLLIQRNDGRFDSASEATFTTDSIAEDVGAVFFDANGDRRPDLYVVSGGSEYTDGASGLQDRLYLNVGSGNFRKAPDHIPNESLSGSRVVPADYDGDGDVDLFVGGRLRPWRYGLDAQSLLLRNDGSGRFTDATAALAPKLQRVGMVTDAAWRDVDRDGRADLVVVGEWMPITIFRNTGGGRLEPLAVRGLERSQGWWNRVVAADFTGDGLVDFVVGNLGLNTRLSASDSQPLTMHVKDFDGNGFVEQIVSNHNQGVSYPLSLRDDLLDALPFLAPRVPTYKDYARKTLKDLFTPSEVGDAVVREARTLATSLARNNGDGSFTLVPLPLEAQLAPVYAILAQDFTGDGHTDLMLAGNFDGFQPEIGRASASHGLILRGDGKGNFAALRSGESGFFVPGQARDVQQLRTRVGSTYIVTRNNDRPLVFKPARARQ
ncbi:MAG: VCBS repeat-containing protein [Gemmatimonadaceae bacterium]